MQKYYFLVHGDLTYSNVALGSLGTFLGWNFASPIYGFYAGNQKRKEEQRLYENYDDYLKSLDMFSNIDTFQIEMIERIIGLIILLIGNITESMLEINLWVMSCRVFKRNLEYAVFDKLVEMCQNINKIIGKYNPMGRNMFVKNFYGELDFTQIVCSQLNENWEYIIPKSYKNKNNVIGLRRYDQRDDFRRGTRDF